MTERERWAVYPLLFLTLGIAVKDKLTGIVDAEVVNAKNVLCNTLLVSDLKGRQQVVVSSDKEGGFVRTVGNENRLKVVLGHTPRVAGLLFIDPEGKLHAIPGSVYLPAGKVEEAPPEGEAAPPSEAAKPEG